jgi:BirA family transcriptional regulator, biotin operon repressor / biotin---[acetyl-CoA-carboxylase] ligase
MINLKNEWIKDIQYFAELDSTQDYALDLAHNSAQEATLVVAGRQISGRGRKGRLWFSPEGGLWFSLVLRPCVAPSTIGILNLGISLAILRAINKVTGLDPLIKWPNDVYLDDKKLAGILVDMDTRSAKCSYAVIGVGINTNLDLDSIPQELKGNAVSVRQAAGKDVDNIILLEACIAEIEKVYTVFKNQEFSKILKYVRDVSYLTGKKVKVLQPNDAQGSVQGLVEGIGVTGTLLIKIDAATPAELYSGTVEVLSYDTEDLT